MTPRPRRSRLLSVLAVTAVTAAGLSVSARASRPLPATPPTAVIAVVDLEKALKGLDERTVKEAEFKARVAEIQKKIDDLEKQIKEKNEAIKMLPVGPEKRTAMEQLRRVVYEYEFEKGFSLKLLNELEGEMLKELYQRLDQAAETVAKKNGYTMVLASDEKVEINSGKAEDVTRTISLKRMLYVDPGHDITQEIITLMNNEFAATKGATGAGSKPAGAAATPPKTPAASAGAGSKPAPKKP